MLNDKDLKQIEARGASAATVRAQVERFKTGFPWMNIAVPFVTDSDELNAKFIKEAEENGFVNLKGHRSVGGMRASIYNAMPIEGVKKLVEFMKKFEEENS